MEQGNVTGSSNEAESGLDEMFRAYRAACPDPEASANFMPALWTRIEARELSTSWFGRVARTLVTAGLAASVILGLMIASRPQPTAFFDGTFVEALHADHISALDPLQLDRISDFQR